MRAVKQRERFVDPSSSVRERVKRVILHKNGWVALVMTLSMSVYLHAIQQKKQVIGELKEHLDLLTREKESAQRTQEDLILQMNSQSDPAWVELVLKRRLGLVPEGQLKVYFYEDNL